MFQLTLRVSRLISALLLVAGCSIALAPTGDAEIVAGINTANEQTLVLFASVANGSSVSEFAPIAGQYDQIIGKFDALRIRAASRDVPTTALTLGAKLGLLSSLQAICPDSPTDCINASPSSLKTIVDILGEMRTQHERSGLPSDIVAIFKLTYETSVQQALTVEMALVR